MLKLVQKRLRCKVVKFWSSPLSPLCDIVVPLMYPVTGKQLLTSNFSKVWFFHFLKLSKNTKTHGFLLYWQHLFKNSCVKYQIMWLYGTAAPSCEKSRSWLVYALSESWLPSGLVSKRGILLLLFPFLFPATAFFSYALCSWPSMCFSGTGTICCPVLCSSFLTWS